MVNLSTCGNETGAFRTCPIPCSRHAWGNFCAVTYTATDSHKISTPPRHTFDHRNPCMTVRRRSSASLSSSSPQQLPELPEVRRREKDLQKMSDLHPLKPFILLCLSDDQTKRPKATELEMVLPSLKEVRLGIHD